MAGVGDAEGDGEEFRVRGEEVVGSLLDVNGGSRAMIEGIAGWLERRKDVS